MSASPPVGSRRLWSLLAALSLCVGCQSRRPDPADFERQIVTGKAARRDLDLLFVIDNSGSMAEEQQALVEVFPQLIGSLRDDEGELPSLHVGVVSTDLGAGPYGLSACSGVGDNGELQMRPRGPDCPVVNEGLFISDEIIRDCSGPAADCRDRNYADDVAIDELFSCIARLGTDGCGFEQPLEAMRLALLNNPDFVRDEATLAVVIVSDEDDCSASNTELFDPSQQDVSDPLGPLGSFRCFDFGVRCEPDDPRALGPKSGCASREDSPYIYPLSRYETFLSQLKGDVRVVLAGILSPSGPIEVVADAEGRPRLSPVCEGSAVSENTQPSIRLNELFARFDSSVTRAECTATIDQARTAMQSLGSSLSAELNDAISGSCIPGCLFDTDDDAPGVQPDCEVIEGADLGEIPPCDGSGTLPCFDARDKGLCPGTVSGVSVTVLRDTPPVEGSPARISCRVRPGTCEPTQSFYDCSGSPRPAGGWPLWALLALLAAPAIAGRGRRRRGRTRS